MAQLTEIITRIEKLIPSRWASEWDNPGLQVGRQAKSIKNILLSLDVTSDTVREASETATDLIISHHPLLFKPLSKITDDSYPGKVAYSLIQQDIALLSLHTNLDALFFDRIKKLIPLINVKPLHPLFPQGKSVLGIGCTGKLRNKISLKNLLQMLQKVFKTDVLKCTGDLSSKIQSLAFCSGSGISLMHEARNADVFITSDIKYHDAVKARDEGIVLVDIGHFFSEHFFISELAQLLKRKLSDLELRFRISQTMSNPLQGVIQ